MRSVLVIGGDDKRAGGHILPGSGTEHSGLRLQVLGGVGGVHAHGLLGGGQAGHIQSGIIRRLLTTGVPGHADVIRPDIAHHAHHGLLARLLGGTAGTAGGGGGTARRCSALGTAGTGGQDGDARQSGCKAQGDLFCGMFHGFSLHSFVHHVCSEFLPTGTSYPRRLNRR